jgi:two-component system, cell cycle sensor histidine kinase and response regulator CckA
VYLPACDEQPAEPAPAAPPAAVTTGSGRVLLVEDSPELADVLHRLLSHAGYQVDIAHNAMDALSRIDAGERPDLVITDVVMPGMTGPELGRQLHARLPTLPVIFTSGHGAGMLGDRDRLDDQAVLIRKPITRNQLLAAVAQMIPGP